MIKFICKNKEESHIVLKENEHLNLLSHTYLENGEIELVFDEKIISDIEYIVKEQGNKISILEGEIAELKEFNTKLIQALQINAIIV